MAVPITGKSAVIDGAQGVGFWKIEHNSSDAVVVHSGTEGAAVRLTGNLDWRGVYQSYGYEPQAMPGGAITFKGEGSDGSGASGAARISRVDIHWDLAEARPIYHNVFFEANGALTIGTPAGSAAAYTVPLPSKGMLTKWGASTVPNVTKMMLSLVSKNAKYVDSSTSGETYRIAGNVDAFWMYRQNLDALSSAVAVDAIARLQFYVTGSLFWDVQDAIVKRIIPIYDIEGGQEKQTKIVAVTVAGKLGIDPSDATHEVKSPDGTNFIDFTD